jgi:hypothetical protein
LDVEPQSGKINNTLNTAILRVNGMTGQTVVYRN